MSVTEATIPLLGASDTTINVSISDVDAGSRKMVEVGECLNIDVHTQRHVASIDMLAFMKTCASPTLLHGDEGTVRMLKTVLVYILEHVDKDVNYFEIVDASQISCSETIGTNLLFMYIQLHNKTWYESKFDAVLQSDENEQDNYARCIELLNDPSFYTKTKSYFKAAPRLIQQVLPSVTTFHELFVKVHRQDPRNYCMYANDWFTPFLQTTLFTEIKALSLWKIPAHTVRTWLQAGGQKRNGPTITRESIVYAGRKHKVYVGKRGGRYVQSHGTFISLKRCERR